MEAKEIVFELTNGGRLKVSISVLETISKYVQDDSEKKEAGGIMIGRFIKDSKDIVIDKVTVPMAGDKQTRYSFKRVSPLHQKVLDDEWNRTNGRSNYQGEWHTHPEENPSPSGKDRRDWKRKLKTDKFPSRYLYFLIAGINHLQIWEGDRRTLNIIKLKTLKASYGHTKGDHHYST